MSVAEHTPTLSERRLARAAVNDEQANAIEQVLINGDLKALTPEQRNVYYMRLCESAGLNPLTQPFEYLTLNGKLVLYAKKSCTDQLRAVHDISVVDMDEEERRDVCIVTVKVRNAKGRTDMGKGAVNVAGLKGDALANAIMKAETKAKRRATLSICGLGLLDETEVETIPGDHIAPDVSAPPAAGETPARQQQSAHSARKEGVWERFVEKLRGFDDIDALEQWWTSAATQKAIDAMPGTWPEQAAEEYEKKQEALLGAGAP